MLAPSDWVEKYICLEITLSGLKTGSGAVP